MNGSQEIWAAINKPFTRVTVIRADPNAPKGEPISVERWAEIGAEAVRCWGLTTRAYNQCKDHPLYGPAIVQLELAEARVQGVADGLAAAFKKLTQKETPHVR